MTAEAVNTPHAIALYGLLPLLLAVALAYTYVALRALLRWCEAALDRWIQRHIDRALAGPWNDGLDQAAADRIWAAIAADLDCAALPTYNPEGQQR